MLLLQILKTFTAPYCKPCCDRVVGRARFHRLLQPNPELQEIHSSLGLALGSGIVRKLLTKNWLSLVWRLVTIPAENGLIFEDAFL